MKRYCHQRPARGENRSAFIDSYDFCVQYAEMGVSKLQASMFSGLTSQASHISRTNGIHTELLQEFAGSPRTPMRTPPWKMGPTAV